MSSVADYVVIAAGSSERQVSALERHVVDEMKELNVRPFGIEGTDKHRWVLIDYVDVIVHIFHEPMREYFDIEGLWADAPRVTRPQDDESPAAELAEGLAP